MFIKSWVPARLVFRNLVYHVMAGSCATITREPSQGRKAAALSGCFCAPQTAWSSLVRSDCFLGPGSPGRHLLGQIVFLDQVRLVVTCFIRLFSWTRFAWSSLVRSDCFLGPGSPGRHLFYQIVFLDQVRLVVTCFIRLFFWTKFAWSSLVDTLVIPDSCLHATTGNL